MSVFRPVVDPSSPLKPQEDVEMLAQQEESLDADESNPFDIIYTSQRPPSAREVDERNELDVDVDEKQVERIATQAAWKQEEEIAQAELDGGGDAMDVTPGSKAKRTAYGDLEDEIVAHMRDADADGDDEQESFEFSSKLTQMHSQRKQNTLLRTPGKTQRWDKTLSNTPVQHQNAPFTPSRLRQSTTTPTKEGADASGNPYYPGSGSSSASNRKLSPTKSPVVRNLFAKPKPPPGTPSKNQRNLGPRRAGGMALRNPFVDDGLRDQAIAEDDVFGSDETVVPARPQPELGIAQDEVDMVASRATMDGEIDADSDDPEAGLDIPMATDVDARAQARVVDPLSVSLGIKRHREPWDEVDEWEPTFKEDILPKSALSHRSTTRDQHHTPTNGSTNGQEHTPLAPTYVSGQDLRAKKRARVMFQDEAVPATFHQPPRHSGETVTSDTTSANSEDMPLDRNSWVYRPAPMSREDMLSSLEDYGQPYIVNKKPHFSVHTDVPLKAKSFGTDVHHLAHDAVAQLEPFDFQARQTAIRKSRGKKSTPTQSVNHWVYMPLPPDQKTVTEWLKRDHAAKATKGK
ncbi:hypothetical protein QFC22_001204 [Naganishia vaughanmartiniae]|uniref:Uncharacterized protein n=1 Tax=Naganishia vaughanmartiniae TaxID=1424756 RepID=A0ACC2XK73_9TREE|nr:hypothetical protein QFC22_001204 [Naganishia vaughanmartiniae]